MMIVINLLKKFRRSRYTQKLFFILLIYLFAVALFTYKQNWTSGNGPFSDDSSLNAAENGGDEKTSKNENFYRILGDNETLPLNSPRKVNGTVEIAPGFAGQPKFILFWNGGGEFGQQHLGGCPDWNCVITADRSLANHSGALVFYGGAFDSPKYRLANQRYVFFTQESPMHASASAPYADFYNYTLGYRRDSDAPCPYGYTVERKQTLYPTTLALRQYLNETISKKRHLAAWFVSNCGAPSGRSRLVDELKKYIEIDVYGACGTLSCPKGPDCNKMLEKEYKFYFAFENSICKDYMTEKFWERMNMDLVVVVLKRAVVERYVPPYSFIAADDFPDVKSFGEFLKKLDADDELYGKYLRWKNRYQLQLPYIAALITVVTVAAQLLQSNEELVKPAVLS